MKNHTCCGNCRWSATEYGHQCSYLVCRRLPPFPDDRGRGVWPRVEHAAFCGEFEMSAEAIERINKEPA